MGKNQNDRLFNHFQVIGTCLTELIQDKDAHGKVNYTLHIKTDGEYPVEVRVHFYALNSSDKTIIICILIIIIALITNVYITFLFHVAHLVRVSVAIAI